MQSQQAWAEGGLSSDVDCSGIISQVGVVGTSVFAVAHMAVAVDQLLLWAANRDPLGQAWLLQLWLLLGWGSHGMGSISQGELTSIQLDGSVTKKTSASMNETSSSITHWSSIVLLARQ